MGSVLVSREQCPRSLPTLLPAVAARFHLGLPRYRDEPTIAAPIYRVSVVSREQFSLLQRRCFMIAPVQFSICGNRDFGYWLKVALLKTPPAKHDNYDYDQERDHGGKYRNCRRYKHR